MVPKSKVIAVVLFFACATVLIGASTGRRWLTRSTQHIAPRVTNKTNSVQVSNIRHLSDGGVELTIVNQSGVPLYGYTITTGDKSVKKGMTVLQTAIPVGPGQTTTERVSADSLESESVANGGQSAEIVLSALYLEGGKVEGDADESGKLKQRLLGIKEQAKAAIKVLREANNSPEQDTEKLIATIESKARSMPVKDESPPSSIEHQSGRKSLNDWLLGDIRKVRMKSATSALQMKAHLAELVSYYQRLAEKL